MKLSIVIVNWNTKELLAQCLESIYAHPPEGGVEVIVVDNASTDDSASNAQRKFPQALIIYNQTNLGFAAANNLAVRQSQGEHVLLLNPDTVIGPGALQILLDFLANQPKAGAAGARLVNPDGSLQPSCSPEPTLKREFLRLFHIAGVRPDGYYEMKDWGLAEPRRVDTVLGASLLIRGALLREIGLLDESFFIYSEEVDLCHRLRKAGWEIYWVPQALVVHYGGQSTRLVASEMFLRLYQAKVQYFRKHRGPLAVLIYKLILFGASLSRLILAPAAWIEPSQRREQHLSLIGNYQRLIKALPQF
jgi:hypothetical protein